MGPTAWITLPSRRLARITPVAAALLAVTACGGGSSEPSTSSPPPTYSIGGTVSGLDAGESLALHLSGGDDLTVSANGAFTFATKVIGDGGYAVSVRVQPQGKSCAVTDGAGTATANVTNVAVACSGPTTVGPYTVGGTVSGLVGQGLTLAIYNPANTAHHTVLMGVLAISSNGLYRTARVPDGYGVLVQDQPHSPAQRCVVRHPWGSLLMGAMPDDVTDVDVICGEFSYVISTAANTISTFTVDAHTGAIISAGPPVSAGSSPAAIAMTRDKQYLYVGNGASNDVSAFAVNPGTGTLKATLGAPVAAGTNPRALARYTAVDVGYGPPLITDYLYVANAGSNDLSVFRIDDRTGVLTPLSPASYPTEAGPSALVIDSGPFLYAANSGGSNGISAFTIDTRSGGLTPIVGSPFPSGGGVSDFALGGGGQFLYAAIASSGAATILGFEVNPSTGALASLSGFPLALPSCRYIVADQAGAYLYAAAGTNVFGYGIDQKTGALDPLPGFPVAVGDEADTLSVDPTNQFLYVGNGSAGAVAGFALDAATGALTSMPGSPFAVGQSPDVIATL